MIVGAIVGALLGPICGLVIAQLLSDQTVRPDSDAGLIFGIVYIINTAAGLPIGLGASFLIVGTTHLTARMGPSEHATKRAAFGAAVGGVLAVLLTTAILTVAGPLTAWAIPVLAATCIPLTTVIALAYCSRPRRPVRLPSAQQ